MKLVFLIISLYIIPLDFTHSQSGWISQKIGNKQFVDINFINNSTGFIIGYDSVILKTTNTGNNWQTIRTNIPATNGGIICGYFNNENRGMIGSLGGVYRTSNGGLTWIFSPVPSIGLSAISMCKFTDSITGYACGWDAYPFPMISGYDGVLWKSTDGGNSWFELIRKTGDDFNGFQLNGLDSIKILGQTKIFSSINNGLNWSEKSILTNPAIYPRSFSNPFNDTIYISGSGGVIKSTDNGNNWFISLQLNQNNSLWSLALQNTNKIYSVGNSGQIYFTSNSGNNWINQNSNSNQKLNSVFFVNKDTGFVVGDSGIILKTFTGGLSKIEANYSNIPDYINLEQNFPNPFNPVTKIKFKISKSGDYLLEIFNLQGKKIETLINRKLYNGDFEVLWNASNYPSGIYFYKLKSESHNITKKMMLVK
ncbi:MAG: T9SS type A sorting domain-containing protein [Ignavibacteria bacterium]|nr:T9SS type A sorting domain-containing protein [Ignavibacteria bacterium]